MDKFDKLAEGKDFESRKAGNLVGNDWVQAKCKFTGSPKLKYKVSLNWSGDRTYEYFDNPEKAVVKFNELKEEHGLE